MLVGVNVAVLGLSRRHRITRYPLRSMLLSPAPKATGIARTLAIMSIVACEALTDFDAPLKTTPTLSMITTRIAIDTISSMSVNAERNVLLNGCSFC